MKLSELIKQSSFASPNQEAILNVMVSSAWVHAELNAAMQPHGITPAQYNVLRILRGAHPRLMTCSAIGERLLDRTPDVTRLLNRLETAGLVHRKRSDEDRRVVEVGISQKGAALLEAMHPIIENLQLRMTRHLSEDDLHSLSALLERLREDQKG